MGRPSLLDKATWKTLVAMMRKTMRHNLAADAAGISRATMRRWMRRGEAGEEPFASLLTDMLKAKAERQAEIMEEIHDQGRDSWQALAWQLERSAPEEFGMVSALRESATDETQVTSRESRRAKLREMWGRVDGEDDQAEASDADA